MHASLFSVWMKPLSKSPWPYKCPQTRNAESKFGTLSYLFGVAVAHSKLMEAREEVWSDSQNLGVELRGSWHGRGPGQENHSLCSLRMENNSDQSAATEVTATEQEMKPNHEPNATMFSAFSQYACTILTVHLQNTWSSLKQWLGSCQILRQGHKF